MKNFYIVRKGDYDAYRIVCAEDKEEAAEQIEEDEAGKVIIYDEEIYQKYFEDNYLSADQTRPRAGLFVQQIKGRLDGFYSLCYTIIVPREERK